MKFNLVAAIIAGTTLSLGLAANMPAARAVSLIPTTEGEVLTNLGCIANSCIDTQELGYKVTSLEYDAYNTGTGKKYAQSRLFVDNRQTANDWGSGIKFLTKDAGTNTTMNQYWLRPVAYGTDGKPLEEGQLEVGRFLIEFDPRLSDVSLDFFDAEFSDLTGILEVNGESVKDLLLKKGPNDGIQSLSVKNVKSLLIQLGGQNVPGFKTGDGVSLSGVRSSGIPVPEPGTTVSLGALAVVGMFGLQRRKKVSRAG